MKPSPRKPTYDRLLIGLSSLLEQARHTAARAVNALMTATYWEMGRQIVEHEQHGEQRAGYGEQLLERLSVDLTARFGRGFSRFNLARFREFYIVFPPQRIRATLSLKSGADVRAIPSLESTAPSSQRPDGKFETLSRIVGLPDLSAAFPLSWSHYVHLIRRSRSPEARDFYHTEALRGGWSVRQLDRQMASLFYERALLSKNKAAMLTKGAKARVGERLSAEEEIKDPCVLEFLGLKDEYSESQMEEALILHLEHFLLELGADFTFVGRQKRLRIGHEWYRADLLFFHRRLHCLIIIDLKVGRFTHADAGQMHLYLNYARAHWTHPGENPPVGLILCAEKDEAMARYALEGLPNKVLAREYRLTLPKEKLLAAEVEKTRRRLEART